MIGDPDYVAVSNIPLFTELSEASSRRECVNISISNDTILEDTESFEVSLASSPSSPVRITQGVSIVYIIDDDGVRIGLKERTIVVPEGGPQHIPICVEMVGRFQQSIEVVLESQPGTAHGEIREPVILYSTLHFFLFSCTFINRWCRLHICLAYFNLQSSTGHGTRNMHEHFSH